MDYAKGKVKKYSREYTRTLKNGEKKKYKTEQVQITIPKQENIFKDDEEVLILHNNSLDDINSSDEMFAALEFQTYLLKQEIIDLNEKIMDKNNEISNLNEEIELLNKKLDKKEVKIDNNSEFIELQKAYIDQLNNYNSLKEKLVMMKSNEVYYKNMINKLKNFILYED